MVHITQLVAGCCVALALAPAAVARPTSLRSASVDLKYVLSSMTILEDYNADPLVRIVSVGDSGECDPDHEATTCPKDQLLISAAEDVEGPQSPVAWQTPRKIGWAFVGWIDKPKFGAKGQIEAAFETSVCEAPEPVESGRVNPRKGGWWRSVRYRIQIEGSRANMIPMSSYRDGKECAL